VLKNSSQLSSLKCEELCRENQELQEEYLKIAKECYELKALAEMKQVQNR
jgi:hypothetical protein